MSIPFSPEAVPLLLDWYRRCRRELPWRETKDPYAVLVSEIMLQQTRAETVKPYFQRFLSALPTVEALAGADEFALLKLWEGLGYYSRVRNLRRAACVVMERYGGVIPSETEALLSLPGIGPYTAGAVASIAFDRPVPAVDGNVLRVLARLTGDDTDVLSSSARGRAERAIAPHIPSESPGDFTQSLIELGALVCTPGVPSCGECPLQLLCCARREGREGELPVRLSKTKRRTERRTVLVIRPRDGERGGGVFLRRRPSEGLLGGLYEFPCLEEHKAPEEVVAYLTSLGWVVGEITPLPEARHLFSHVEWRMIGYAVTVEAIPHEEVGWLLAEPEEMDKVYAIPSAYGVYRACCTP